MACRCAILLDELDDYRGLRKGRALGHIVVETRTANAVPLLRYSCSKRVMAMPTGQLNARRVGMKCAPQPVTGQLNVGNCTPSVATFALVTQEGMFA